MHTNRRKPQEVPFYGRYLWHIFCICIAISFIASAYAVRFHGIEFKQTGVVMLFVIPGPVAVYELVPLFRKPKS